MQSRETGQRSVAVRTGSYTLRAREPAPSHAPREPSRRPSAWATATSGLQGGPSQWGLV